MNVMHVIKRLVMFCALSACATDPVPLDPIGTWDNLYSWTAGTCGLTTPGKFPFAVLQAGETTFVIQDPDPSVATASGTFFCSETSCLLTLHETFSTVSGGMTTTGTVDANLTLDELDSIGGTGTLGIQMPNGSACSQQFTATGTHR